MSDWERNLQQLTDDATGCLAQWTFEDIRAFVDFLCSNSPQLVVAYHDQRPSDEPRRRAEADYSRRAIQIAAIHSAKERRCPRCQRSAALKAVSNGWQCRWQGCGFTSLREAVTRR